MDHKAKRIRLWKRDPRCYYCGIETILYPYAHVNKEPIPDNAATLEHLDSRLNPMRGTYRGTGKRRLVLACLKCNQAANDRELAALPKEELWRRSNNKDMDEMTDNEMIALALNMWANRIETGNPDLTATDAHAMKRKINPMPPESMRRVLRLRELAEGRSVTNSKLMEQFHRLWGQAKSNVYDKKEWMEMQRILQEYLRQ